MSAMHLEVRLRHEIQHVVSQLEILIAPQVLESTARTTNLSSVFLPFDVDAEITHVIAVIKDVDPLCTRKRFQKLVELWDQERVGALTLQLLEGPRNFLGRMLVDEIPQAIAQSG